MLSAPTLSSLVLQLAEIPSEWLNDATVYVLELRTAGAGFRLVQPESAGVGQVCASVYPGHAHVVYGVVGL